MFMIFFSAHLERTLDAAKVDIEKHTEETLDKQKYLATEKAMAKLDKNSRQEVLDNDWLKREVSENVPCECDCKSWLC